MHLRCFALLLWFLADILSKVSGMRWGEVICFSPITIEASSRMLGLCQIQPFFITAECLGSRELQVVFSDGAKRIVFYTVQSHCHCNARVCRHFWDVNAAFV